MAVGLTAKIVLLASIGGCAASRRAGRVVLGHADKQEEPEITPMEGAFTTSKYDYDPRPGGEYKDTENIIEMLKTAAYMNPEKLVFRTPRQDETGALVPHGRMAGSKYSYRYFKTNWTEYHEKAMDAATAFVSLGLQPMDTCHIKGINSPEWLMAYMGCIAAGGVPVGLYDQDSPKTLLHKAKDSGANFVILGSAVDLDVYAEFLDEIPTAKHFILWDGGRQREALLPSTTEIFWKAERQLLHWDTFLQLVRESSQKDAALTPRLLENPTKHRDTNFNGVTAGSVPWHATPFVVALPYGCQIATACRSWWKRRGCRSPSPMGR